MKHYSPTGRRNHSRPLKRLLDTWDWNGSTSGTTPRQIYNDDGHLDGLRKAMKDLWCMLKFYFRASTIRSRNFCFSFAQIARYWMLWGSLKTGQESNFLSPVETEKSCEDRSIFSLSASQIQNTCINHLTPFIHSFIHSFIHFI